MRRSRGAPLAVALSVLCAISALAQPLHAQDQWSAKKAAAVSRACRWLASQQLPDGSFASPARNLNPNVWETALSLVALLRCGSAAHRGAIARGFAFLDANWIEEGGLPESVGRRLSPHHKSHCIETTSTALRAYAAAGKHAQARTLRDFLFSKQEADGGWKIGYPEAPTFPNGDMLEVFPSVTGFALSAAAVVPGGDRRKAERGLASLAARQKPEGDWGAFPDYFWTPYYATAPIVEAFAAWGRRDDPVVQRVVRFTRERQSKDGSWGDAGVPGTTSREFWTALALSTLQAAGDQAPRDVVDRGTAYLLGRQQPDGRWIGGQFKSAFMQNAEKREDLSVTTLAIVVLSPSGGR